MERYSIIEVKNKREIVLLKGRPCVWGKCKFCDYVLDNSEDDFHNAKINEKVLSKITGVHGKLEVINSGSVFELPPETLKMIKNIISEKNISTLYFEVYYNYRNRLSEIRDFFSGTEVLFKCGLETFDEDFRNNVLNKNIKIDSIEEISEIFNVVCLMVGIKGQTKEMIEKDISLVTKYFDRACINVYVDNTTEIKADSELINWFRKNYSYLEKMENIEILWNNCDFGVGGENLEQ